MQFKESDPVLIPATVDENECFRFGIGLKRVEVFEAPPGTIPDTRDQPNVVTEAMVGAGAAELSSMVNGPKWVGDKEAVERLWNAMERERIRSLAPAEPLKVGDRVVYRPTLNVGDLEAIKGDRAWVRYETGDDVVVPLARLTRVEG